MRHPRDTLLYAVLSYVASQHEDETHANYSDELDYKEEALDRAAIEYVQFLSTGKA